MKILTWALNVVLGVAYGVAVSIGAAVLFAITPILVAITLCNGGRIPQWMQCE